MTLSADGFAVAGRLCDGEALVAAREAAASLLAAHGAPSEYGVIALDAWRRAEPLRALLPALAAFARAALSAPEVIVFQDLVIAKALEGDTTIPYHQDQASLPLDREALIAWVALDDADIPRGCMHYVRGTHLLGDRRPAAFTGATPTAAAAALPPIDTTGREIVAAPVTAGEVLLHSSMTWHGSPPNVTRSPRRAWSVWFVHPDARWAPDRTPHPFLFELSPVAGTPLPPDRFPRF